MARDVPREERPERPDAAAMDIERLFALADEARVEARGALADGHEDLEDADDLFANGASMRVRRARHGRPRIVPLPGGDCHVCFGADCPNVYADMHKQLVCSVSGFVVGTQCTRETDATWTGRSTASANPDDSAGTPVGGWQKRRDMFAASQQAWETARRIDADAMSAHDAWAAQTEQDGPPPARTSSKRGALCVDQADAHESSEAAKRQRCAARRETCSKDARDKLEAEALCVIAKLMTGEAAAPAPAPAQAPDARLQNVEFVRRLALRRYIRQCADAASSPSMDGVHNVCVAANEFVREQRRRATAPSDTGARPSAKAASSGQVRRILAKLVVALWLAACQTPHMTQGRRGGDSFRPFAAGVLYQLKRGLYLSSGVCIIPQLHELSELLPALRCPNATPAAKQLQSSSHRGICSLHKSIASMGELQGHDLNAVTMAFAAAATDSSLLRAVVGQQAE